MQKRPSSTFSNDDTSLKDEAEYHEANELLKRAILPPHSNNALEEQDGGEYARLPDRRRWLRPFSLAFSILFLGTILLRSSMILTKRHPTQSQTSSSQNADGSNRPLGIELHPELHVSRAPETITHYWNITSAFRSPDGVKKEVYLVNGLFPGPTIECRSGDRLVIHVTNALNIEGVSIHWHGLPMRNANAMDGAVGFTQCPIPAGGTFKYEFVIDQGTSGTFWWHAHSQVQRGDGMYGGLVVHKPADKGVDMEEYGYEKEVLLLIGDWYHRSAHEVLEWYTSARGFGNEPVPDSLLINGAGRFVCSMAVPARPIECVDVWAPGLFIEHEQIQPTRLRIANVGSLAGFTLAIGSLALTPLMVDGDCRVTATPSDSLGILYPGERVDALLKVDGGTVPAGARLHISLDPENFKYGNPALRPNQSFPILTTAENITDELSSDLMAPLKHFDLATATNQRPDTKFSNSQTAEQTILLYAKTEKLAKFSNHPMGFINRTSWAPQASPLHPLISLARTSWDGNQLIPFIPNSPAKPLWVDIVVNNLDDGAHPFHLHGYQFYVLASYRSEHGWGSYSPYAESGNSAIRPKLNLIDPLRKDTISIPRRGYVVLRFLADNPGIWMFHCHVLFHQASGMAMGFLVGGDNEHSVLDVEAEKLCTFDNRI